MTKHTPKLPSHRVFKPHSGNKFRHCVHNQLTHPLTTTKKKILTMWHFKFLLRCC